MSAIRQTLTILKRIFIVIGIFVAFTLGLSGAIYLSLRSSETRVPDVIGKDRLSAENTISDAGLNFRVRALRPTSDAKPDTVLIQLPHAGEIVKVGQTVAVDISRPSPNGEASTPPNTDSDNSNKQESSSSNTSANSNTNTEKKPVNRNTNKNTNANANRPANRNQNANANREPGNLNANSSATPARSNANSTETPARTNTNRGANSNANRRPIPVPTP